MTKNPPTPRRGPPPGMPALAVPLGALAACEPTLHRDDLQGVWLGLGCKNAWHWISREDVAMREGLHDSDD